MQALKVATVPMHVKSMDQYVLVDKEAYNKLLDQSLLGRSWIMDDLRDRCGNKSIKWIKENIIEIQNTADRLAEWSNKVK